MQRRAAAAYIAFFLVIAAGSYAFIATAEAPDVTISGDDVRELQVNDTVTVDDRTYTVTEVSAEAESGGGGHGGGGGELSYTLRLEWTNESAVYTETWTSNSTVGFEGQERRVLTENGTNDVVIRSEPSAELSPRWSDGVQYVDGNPDQGGRQDVPVTQWIAESENESVGYVNFTEGDTFQYQGNETTVANVSNSTVRLEWTAPKTNTVSTSNNQNFTLNEQEFAVHFASNDTVLWGEGTATQERLHQSIQTEERFHSRINGVWGVTITSAIAGLLLVALAFLPRKE